MTVSRRYERSWLGPDLVAGLTVGAMLVPQAMGYAALAGLAPQYGFYAAIPRWWCTRLWAPAAISGLAPSLGTAILAAAAVAGLAGGDDGRYVALMAALALVVAGLSLVGSVLRLGRLASLLSRPVLVGYITGVGLTLLSSQIATFTGVRITAGTFFPRWWQFVTHLGEVHAATLALGVAALVVLLALRRWPVFPGALIAIAVVTLVAAAWGLDGRGVPLVGAIPSGLAGPSWPDVTIRDLLDLVPAGAGIALVGFTDNVLKAAPSPVTRTTELTPTKSCSRSAPSTSLPVSFRVSRSPRVPVAPRCPRRWGHARSWYRSSPRALWSSPWWPCARRWPRSPGSAIAAVIIAAAFHIIDLPGMRDLWALSRTESALAIVTSLGVIVAGVLPGVLLAVGLSLAVALSRIARPHDAVLGDAPGVDGWVDIEEFPTARATDGLLVFRFDAPLFFLNIERFTERVEQAFAANPGEERWFVMDCEGIGAIDVSAVDGLRELLAQLGARGVVVVAVARANDKVLAMLRRADLLQPDGPMRDYPTIDSAVKAFRAGRD